MKAVSSLDLPQGLDGYACCAFLLSFSVHGMLDQHQSSEFPWMKDCCHSHGVMDRLWALDFVRPLAHALWLRRLSVVWRVCHHSRSFCKGGSKRLCQGTSGAFLRWQRMAPVRQLVDVLVVRLSFVFQKSSSKRTERPALCWWLRCITEILRQSLLPCFWSWAFHSRLEASCWVTLGFARGKTVGDFLASSSSSTCFSWTTRHVLGTSCTKRIAVIHWPKSSCL